MQISGTGILPLHIANAYGLKPLAAANTALAPLGAIRPQRPDTFEPSSGMRNLVAAKVSQPVNFDIPAAARPTAPTAAFQMYTRAADKMEAAIAVQIGRTIDLQG